MNRKRVYRGMKAHGLLLQRHAGGVENRRHDGKIAVTRSNLRWRSDGFEIACDNAEKVRVAATKGVKGEDIRDSMVDAVEYRFGSVNRPPSPIEWLSDNGSGDIASDAKQFARKISLEPLTPPVESPQSNGMAEAFVRAIKRDDARVLSLPDAKTASACCQRGSSATTRAIAIVRLAIVHPASSWRIVRSAAEAGERLSDTSGATTPPSTTTAAPVINEDALDARKEMTDAISCGLPNGFRFYALQKGGDNRA